MISACFGVLVVDGPLVRWAALQITLLIDVRWCAQWHCHSYGCEIWTCGAVECNVPRTRGTRVCDEDSSGCSTRRCFHCRMGKKKKSRSSSSSSYSYYSDMDEEPDWSEGVEQPDDAKQRGNVAQDKQSHVVGENADGEVHDSAGYDKVPNSPKTTLEMRTKMWLSNREAPDAPIQVAMRHLPNDSYSDRLPTYEARVKKKGDGGTVGHEEHGGRKSEAAAGDKVRKVGSGDASVSHVRQGASSKKDRTEQTGRGVVRDGGKKVEHRAGTRVQRDARKDKSDNQGEREKQGRRPYPFREHDSKTSKGKALGKPPPPIVLEDDTDEDVCQAYHKRLKRKRQEFTAEDHVLEKGVRLTPAPPAPPLENDTAAASNEQRTNAGATCSDVPWRVGSAQGGDDEWDEQQCYSEYQGGNVDHGGKHGYSCKQSEGYWCAGQVVPPPPPPVVREGPHLDKPHDWTQDTRVPAPPPATSRGEGSQPRGSGHDSEDGDEREPANCAKGDWIVSRTGKRIPAPPKRLGDGSFASIHAWSLMWLGMGFCVCCVHYLVDFASGFCACALSTPHFGYVCELQLFTVSDGCDSLLGKCGRRDISGCCFRHAITVALKFAGCGARYRASEDMHVAGHIAGTAGWEFRWYPFAQRGISHDGVAIHTLQNTHDLRNTRIITGSCAARLRRTLNWACIDRLRPPHILVDDHREGIQDALQQARLAFIAIARDVASHVNSEAETIDGDGDGRDAMSLEAQPTDSEREMDDFGNEVSECFPSVGATDGGSEASEILDEDNVDIEWVQAGVHGEAHEIINRDPWSCGGKMDQCVCV
eukprot:2531842-Amphidinium_carterae.2